MKTACVFAVASTLFLGGVTAEPVTLDSLLDLRIKANEEYRDEFVEDAKETAYSRILAPLEHKLGQEWVDYLKFVKASKDKKLKIHALRLELLTEIREGYFTLEYAESNEERKEAQADLRVWKEQYEYLKAIIAGKTPQKLSPIPPKPDAADTVPVPPKDIQPLNPLPNKPNPKDELD